ncbi:MAG: T9SS type A sorting domain-containing protein [Saprospiraceae bacterium]|nr:T9SS type A sorting domain-containing protein [Saprospiraceae bacterium]
MKNIFLTCFLFLSIAASAQTNVRAWYAQGQVWIVWQNTMPFPETVGIFKKSSAFTNTTQATLIGRPFQFEYLPGTYFLQTTDPNFTYRIPAPGGGTYQLAPGEGLFVETVLNSGGAYYAVVPWGETTVTAGVNITPNLVQYNYNPVAQPVNCHLQRTEILNSGHKTFWFSMWALGRQDENSGRPDFPVMANAAKNGMPSMFIVSLALNPDTLNGKLMPMTHVFHGGGGVAEQSMANRFPQFNLEPVKGISVAHNDDFPVKTITEDGDTVFTSGRSLWFGWSKNHNPFLAGYAVSQNDTIINYTQRRIMWINDWMVQHFPIDPDRISVMGYSMGSGGATVLAKTFPDKFATACLFNAGFRGAEDPSSIRIVGSKTDNLPTSIKGQNGQTVHIEEVFSLNVPCSDQRDFPIMRVWVGKNDINDRKGWTPEVAAQFRLADSLGRGAQLNSYERPHTYPQLGFHWINDLAPNQQTALDNLATQELYRSNQSFPGFFNHRLETLNNDPGTGILGINNGDGDNWGTWGGHHRWDNGSMIDETGRWEVTAWMEGTATFANDNAPVFALLTDVSIRKPQQFKPAPGQMLEWRVRDIATDQIIQAGQITVRPDGVVVVPQVFVTKETFRKIRIQVYDPSVAVDEPLEKMSNLVVSPNPTTNFIQLTETFDYIQIFDITGHLTQQAKATDMVDVSLLPAGLYFLKTEKGASRFVKQ